jgi:hypothetical protein
MGNSNGKILTLEDINLTNNKCEKCIDDKFISLFNKIKK